MIIKFNSPSSLNLGGDLDFLRVFVKGKTKSPKITDYRIECKNIVTGEIILYGLEEHQFTKYQWLYLDKKDIKAISSVEYKGNRNRKYYYLNTDKNLVHKVLDTWRKADPLVHIGNYLHSFISNFPGYTYAYEFDGVKY